MTNEEILTSYRDANTNYAAEYQRLETHSGQLEDKLAAAEVRLQLRSTDEEMTPQEPWLALQAERIQHEEILVGFREAYDGVVAEYDQLGVQTSQLEIALTSANEQTTRLEQRLEDAVQKLVAQDGVASEEVKLENERLATELATSEHEAGVLEDHLGDARHEMATLRHAHQSALQLQLEAAAADWEMQKAALQQAHQSALQLQLEAAAADCEVHKAALQQELTDLRSRTAEMQDDSLYDARQELANLQQELAESQANAELLRQCVAELNDALALQAKQSREQQTSFETELRLLEDRRLQEGRDSLKERAAFQSDLDQGAALHQVDKDHLGAMLQESNANLHQSQQLADSLQRAANMLQERLESQSSTISVTRRELAASKVQKEAAEKECHEALEELGATRTDHSEEVSRLQADISSKKSLAATVTRLENECERLRADNRSSAEGLVATATRLEEECLQLQADNERLRLSALPCTTCKQDDDPEDTCPAELAAALLRLQQAEEYTRVLDDAYDALKLAADTKIASLEDDLAFARSAAELLQADLTAYATALKERDTEVASNLARLQRLREDLDAADSRLLQSQADARVIQEELTRVQQVIAEHRLTHLFYGSSARAQPALLALGNNLAPPPPSTPLLVTSHRDPIPRRACLPCRACRLLLTMISPIRPPPLSS